MAELDLFATLAGLDVLGLPRPEYAVFGSGPLAVRGLRAARDLDLIVLPALWSHLSRRYPVQAKGDARGIVLGDVEIWDRWTAAVPPVPALIAAADLIAGYHFVRLEAVRAWKLASGRPKDLADVALLQHYLASGGR